MHAQDSRAKEAHDRVSFAALACSGSQLLQMRSCRFWQSAPADQLFQKGKAFRPMSDVKFFKSEDHSSSSFHIVLRLMASMGGILANHVPSRHSFAGALRQCTS